MPLTKINLNQPLTEFPGATWNTLVDIARQRHLGPTQNKQTLDKLLAKNTSGVDAPGGAILRFTGTLTVENRPVFTVTSPDSELQPYYGIAAGPIKDGKIGLFQPARAYYLTSDGTPAFGESWGPASGQWYLRKNRPGFMSFGNASGSGPAARITVVQVPATGVLCKTTTAVNKGSSGTLAVYAGVAHSEANTGLTVLAVNNLGQLGSNRWCWASFNGKAWYLVAAEC